MDNIKTITEMMWSGSNDSDFQAASGSLSIEREELADSSGIPSVLITQLLYKKIDELVDEVNKLKNQ